MGIRTATLNDLPVLTEIGKLCFPPEEAATEKEFEERLKVYPNHFWILENNGDPIGFINGMVTNETRIRDVMFKNASLHEEDGAWQAIFGVNTVPKYRKRGYASKMMEQVIEDAKKQGRKGCILTCKEELIQYYVKLGYKNEGVSQSKLAGAVWYDMRLEF
ncbi:GNAT family N-acetyltransferase [Paenibacillus albiflavus]|uniref:GNAT family N-acetyltransferase n=1 Tax=Paenibacillus albiflavus TaxID=2545760 RepID=A0A4V2WP67_9BACL|nr:GNAT family N-acetyltransferase [Paenibacillus albiflavus]TCZ78112.1 GNAT family N-acetyltransferase [Paenibacillus albiflavus]